MKLISFILLIFFNSAGLYIDTPKFLIFFFFFKDLMQFKYTFFF